MAESKGKKKSAWGEGLKKKALGKETSEEENG